jgi:hypothetical protein
MIHLACDELHPPFLRRLAQETHRCRVARKRLILLTPPLDRCATGQPRLATRRGFAAESPTIDAARLRDHGDGLPSQPRDVAVDRQRPEGKICNRAECTFMNAHMALAAGAVLLLGETSMASTSELAGVVADWRDFTPWLQQGFPQARIRSAATGASSTWSRGVALRLEEHSYSIAVYVHRSQSEVPSLTGMGDLDPEHQLGDVLVRHRAGAGISWSYKNVSASVEDRQTTEPTQQELGRLLRVARSVQAFFEAHLVDHVAEHRPTLRFRGDVSSRGTVGQILHWPVTIGGIRPEHLEVEGNVTMSDGVVTAELAKPGQNRFHLRVCHARTLLCSDWLSHGVEAFASPETEPRFARRLGVLPGRIRGKPTVRIVERLGEPGKERRRGVVLVYALDKQLAMVEVVSPEHTSAGLSLVWRHRVMVGERRFTELPAQAVGSFSTEVINPIQFFRSPRLSVQLAVDGQDWILADGTEPPLQHHELVLRLADAGVSFQAIRSTGEGSTRDQQRLDP